MPEQDIDALIDRGLKAVEEGNLDEAEAALDEARRMAPGTHFRVLHLAGELALERGELEDATSLLHQATDHSAGRNPDIVLSYAECLFNLQELEEAERKIRAMLDDPELAPFDADRGRLLLAQLLLAEDFPEKALEVLDQISDERKAHVAFLSTRGTVLAYDERFDEAIDELQKAAALEPDDPDVHYQLGLAFEQVGRSEDARKRMLAVLRLELEEMKELGDDAPHPPSKQEQDELRSVFEEVMTELPDPLLKLVGTAPITVQTRATEAQVADGMNPRAIVSFLGRPKRDDQEAELHGIVIMRDLLLFEVDDDDDLEIVLLESLSEEFEFFFQQELELA